jgi:hypothetical protein
MTLAWEYQFNVNRRHFQYLISLVVLSHTEPAVAPGGDAVEGAVEGGFGGRAGEEDEVVGDRGRRNVVTREK